MVHPSYQAWSYAQLIQDYNQAVQDNEVELAPCACLHNYIRHENDPIDAKQYEEYIEEAPAEVEHEKPAAQKKCQRIFGLCSRSAGTDKYGCREHYHL